MKRKLFYISDRTGVTVETLGHSLVTQFDEIQFERVIIPYVDTIEKAEKARDRIDAAAEESGSQPIIFSSMVDDECRQIVESSKGAVFDFFDAFIGPMEDVMGIKSSHTVGRSHGMGNGVGYQKWIDAVNYSLDNDDGLRPHKLNKADVVLIGVSRSGKTPTSLYLAMQFGICAANYPLSEEDIEMRSLPKVLQPHKRQLFGLTIDPAQLSKIRQERRPDSRYSSLKQCRSEVQQVEQLFRTEKIPYLNTTAMSVEEIAAGILLETGMKKRASL
jgi:regulator of PEP synthase PpsR (kinase-PPPase family)